MKRFLSIFLAFSFLLLTAGRYNSPSNSSTTSVGYLGTAVNRGIDKEVWITIRTDGRSGSGTSEDAFDGSTQTKFDAVLATLTANTTIHLGVGTFLTNPLTRTWRPLTGWTIEGRDEANTIIQVVPLSISSNQQLVAFGLDSGSQASAGSDYVTVRNLTIDANGQNVTLNGHAYKIGLITLMGSHNLVEHVYGINQYGSQSGTGGGECFGIRLAGYGDNLVSVTDNIIRFCNVTNIRGDYNNAYFMGGSSDTFPATHCQFYGNRAYGVNDGNGFASTTKTALQCLVNTVSLSTSQIFGNTCEDALSIIHHDTGTLVNTDIFSNHGIRIGASMNSINPSSGCKYYNNYMEVQDRNGGSQNYGIQFSSSTNLEIYGNRIVQAGASANNLNGIYTDVGSTGLIHDNVVNVSNPINTVSTSVKQYNNFTSAGVLIGTPTSLIAILAGTRSVFTGIGAPSGNTGADNTGFGYNALNSLTSGTTNTAIGSGSQVNVTNATGNTSLGFTSLQNNGSYNSAFGAQSGQYITGQNNVAVGIYALVNNPNSGNNNVGIGYAAGGSVNTGSNNTLVGASSDVSSGSASYRTGIGSGVSADEDNAVVVGRVSDKLKTAHIKGLTSAPTIAAGSGAGTSPTISLSSGSTDLAGEIVVTAGTTPTVNAVIVTITFNQTYGAAPHVVLWPSNANAATLGFLPYVNETTTTFTVNNGVSLALAAATQYKYNYIAVQ